MADHDNSIIEMPMFPLGSVLFPRGVLPLHIFGTATDQHNTKHAVGFKRMIQQLLVTGLEVGGGEQRNTIGTMAHIDDYQRFDDGRAAVVSTGRDRFEVVEWLDDDPYPRARVRALPAEIAIAEHRELFATARQTFDELIDLGHRLGRLDSVPESDWESDVEEATWQLAGRSPCTALDQYSILAAPDRSARLTKINELLKEVYADLELMGELGSRGD